MVRLIEDVQGLFGLGQDHAAEGVFVARHGQVGKHQVLVRHHDIGVVRVVVAVDLGQLRQRRLRLGAAAGDKADSVISLGAGH